MLSGNGQVGPLFGVSTTIQIWTSFILIIFNQFLIGFKNPLTRFLFNFVCILLQLAVTHGLCKLLGYRDESLGQWKQVKNNIMRWRVISYLWNNASNSSPLKIFIKNRSLSIYCISWNFRGGFIFADFAHQYPPAKLTTRENVKIENYLMLFNVAEIKNREFNNPRKC